MLRLIYCILFIFISFGDRLHSANAADICDQSWQSLCQQASHPVQGFLVRSLYKEAIAEIQSDLKIDQEPQKRARLLAILASCYLHDQNEEKAYEAYLDALSCLPITCGSSPSRGELNAYNELLDLYLQALDRPGQFREPLEKRVVEITSDNPKYYLAKYFLATSRANDGKFLDFFVCFFDAASHRPDCFLASKCRALIEIKLSEKVQTRDMQLKHLEQAKSYLLDAMKKEPRDRTLHRSLLAICTPEERSRIVGLILDSVIDNNVKMAKNDVRFYVEIAIATNQEPKAQQLLGLTKSWFGYSRTIEDLEKLLEAAPKLTYGAEQAGKK